MRLRSISLQKLIILCLIISSIIPDIGIKFSTGGFTWTVYRLFVLLSIVLVFAGGAKVTLEKKTYITKWIGFMAFWSIYGLAFLFIGKYSDMHNGFIELLSIFNGFIVVYIVGKFLESQNNRDKTISLIYWLLNLMILIGIVEIITGRHWMASAYYDKTSSVFLYTNTHQATGLMYNMNDFSAMITCMSPILIDNRFGKKRLITLVGVLLINQVNDATACTFALVVFAGFYFLIIQGGRTRRAFAYRLIFWGLVSAGLVFIITSGAGLINRSDFIGAMARQIFNARNSTGSLYIRLTTYKGAFHAWLTTGMLGMGPSGYSNYFMTHTSLSGLVNPHSLILEILTQYGIIIAAWFLWLLYKMYIAARKMYETADEEIHTKGLMVIAFVIIYFIASFAPSTFIGYAYQWLLIAVMCSLLDSGQEIGGISYA